MKIKAYSEFGFILWYYLPKAYFLHTKNNLTSTESRIGTKGVFYFSDNHLEKNIVQDPPDFYPESNTCYQHNPPNFTLDSWLPPPIKEHYKNNRFIFDKPIVTIHNKTTLEWAGSGIFNYFNSEGLEKIILSLKEDYTIVYIRPPVNNIKTFVGDPGQITIDIKDEKIIRKHNVIFLNDLLETNKDLTYNELQFMILANSDKHIASAGEAVIPAYFGGETLIYNCPNCKSHNRGVWKSGSWMEMLSGSKITGFNDYDNIKKHIEKNWI